ncbi:hypothetical protein UF66_1101 [Staphylococcus cohnii subsp. cohnii]|uniref:Uncharacterized protein n=1 Tax=Staphylococcus cohnii subsp. cohnii TaxID=74704 RepID=A0A0M2NZ53_STACC|nr:hypothetical protein UF66_1101 [Staphylococcus cohnii subsp. cohnii]
MANTIHGILNNLGSLIASLGVVRFSVSNVFGIDFLKIEPQHENASY